MMHTVLFFQFTYYRRALDFKGTSCRREFWFPAIVNAIIYFIIYLGILWPRNPENLSVYRSLIIAILYFPSVACTARRLRDIGKSPWLAVLLFVPPATYCIWWLMTLPGLTSIEVPDRIYVPRAERKRAAEAAERRRREMEEQDEERRRKREAEVNSIETGFAQIVTTPYMNAYRTWYQLKGYEDRFYAWRFHCDPIQERSPAYYHAATIPYPNMKIHFDFYNGQFEEVAPADQIMVRNEERIRTMEKIIIAAGIPAQNMPNASIADAPTLECLHENNNPLAHFYGATTPKFQYRWDVPDLFKDIEWTALAMRDDVERIFKIRIQEYYDDYMSMRAGLKGELAVQEVLDLHADAFIVMHNLRIEAERNGSYESAEIDTLVLAPNGIFSIEVKNFGASGGDIVIEADGSWYRETKGRNGHPVRQPMKNPFQQNDRHIAILERFINQRLGRTMGNRAYVENIITMANDTVHIENKVPGGLSVTRIGSLYSQLTRDRTVKFTQVELETIRDMLEQASVPSKSYALPDYTDELRSYVQGYQMLCQYPKELYEKYLETTR